MLEFFLSFLQGMDVGDLPDGVDPSFLAALPDDMRQEVIDEQRRLQNIRQQAAQQQEQQGVQEVNPEFLAALPPNIQVSYRLNEFRITFICEFCFIFLVGGGACSATDRATATGRGNCEPRCTAR